MLRKGLLTLKTYRDVELLIICDVIKAFIATNDGRNY